MPQVITAMLIFSITEVELLFVWFCQSRITTNFTWFAFRKKTKQKKTDVPSQTFKKNAPGLGMGTHLSIVCHSF